MYLKKKIKYRTYLQSACEDEGDGDEEEEDEITEPVEETRYQVHT